MVFNECPLITSDRSYQQYQRSRVSRFWLPNQAMAQKSNSIREKKSLAPESVHRNKSEIAIGYLRFENKEQTKITAARLMPSSIHLLRKGEGTIRQWQRK